MDATNIPDRLTDLDNQIAEVENQIAVLRRMSAARHERRGKKAIDREIAALQAKHEHLVRQIEAATVGARGAWEVVP